MKKLINSIIIASMTLGCSTYQINPMSQSEMISKMNSESFTSDNGITINYRIYCPYSESKLPIVFYLHGLGERRSDNESQLDFGAGALMTISSEEEYSAIIVAPQCGPKHMWRDDDMQEALSQFIEMLSSNPIVDRERIYVTGFSMGGDGTWKIAINYPELISTAMPVCGGPLESMEPDRPQVREETSLLNIWAFNNYDDQIIRPNYSKWLFSQIWSYRINDNLNFTESLEGDHSSKEVYSNRKYMTWFLSTRKKDR